MVDLHIYKTPTLLKKLYPSAIWDIPTTNGEKCIYLTFDDGPVPEATPFVLSVLKKFGAKATFFAVGENVQKHPLEYDMVVADGHSVGNHTFNHLKGWHTPNNAYFENVHKCEDEIDNGNMPSKKLFRPPYGRIKTSQFNALKNEYKIIMWDVLSGDYNSSLKSKSILKNIIKATDDGAIVVFHDSMKALPHLMYILEPYMKHFDEKGFSFKPL